MNYIPGQKVLFKRKGSIISGEVLGEKKTFFGTKYVLRFDQYDRWYDKSIVVKLIASRNIVCVDN